MPTNLAIWTKQYEIELRKAVQQFPKEYGFGPEMVPGVCAKMAYVFEKGTYNKDGRAIKATCKALGIPYTYAGINSYIRGPKACHACGKISKEDYCGYCMTA